MRSDLIKYLFCSLILFINTSNLNGQSKNLRTDTLYSNNVDSIFLYANWVFKQKNNLPESIGTYLYSGKKTELILLESSKMDIANKNARQVFASIPGVFVYDMDGAGNQINIATRGLDPHRGWEFNIRRNGVITNSDLYAYPASHFSMPLESIEKIELTRGTGAIQYGSQFGGMLNYISKKWDTTKKIKFQNINTIGSYNMLSNYSAISGNNKKWHYYISMYFKKRDGFRDIEHTDAHYENISFQYDVSSKMNLQIDWARSEYVYRMPGPLTTLMYLQNPQQASRKRNYFNPKIHIPSLKLNWDIGQSTKIALISSAVLGERNSVLFDKASTISDTINLATNNFNPRQVDIDIFNSYTNEFRLYHQYGENKKNSFVGGVQLINNDLHRRQQGVGTVSTNFDLNVLNNNWGRDLHFRTINTSFFIENKISLSDKLLFIMGGRIEKGVSKFEGKIGYIHSDSIPLKINHNFPLLSFGFEYFIDKNINLYGGIAQTYRSMLMKDLIPSTQYEIVDKNIKDAKGYNAELGIRGNAGTFKWDINLFLLKISNKYGNLAFQDINGNYLTFRTNIGNSINLGLESFIESNIYIDNNYSISIFSSTALMDARYKNAFIKYGNINLNITNNKVESVPDITSRNGLTLRNLKFSTSLLWSYTSSSFADALNTAQSSLNGAIGIVPSYSLIDLNYTYHFSPKIDCQLSINNISNKIYFTKRPMFYPGPGIWPSEGRAAFITIRYSL